MADKNPHRCVIDHDGYYKTFVLLINKGDGTAIPYAYDLEPGEKLIEASPPSNMIAPRWISTAWEETATPEEIEAAKPEPQPPPPPTESELLAVETMMLIASIQEETMMALAELSMAIVQSQGVSTDV